MRILLVLLCVFVGACESCDFSFGSIRVGVEVTPADAVGTVELCAEKQPCSELPLPYADPNASTPKGGSAPFTNLIPFTVGWKGYAVCKHPEMVVTVRTKECEPVVVVRDRQAPTKPLGPRTEDGAVLIRVDVECDGDSA